MSSDKQDSTGSAWPAAGLALGLARAQLVDPALLARLYKAKVALSVRDWFAEPRHALELQRVSLEFFNRLERGEYRIDACRGSPDAERSAIAVGELRAWRIDYHQNRAVDQAGIPWFDLRVYFGSALASSPPTPPAVALPRPEPAEPTQPPDKLAAPPEPATDPVDPTPTPEPMPAREAELPETAQPPATPIVPELTLDPSVAERPAEPSAPPDKPAELQSPTPTPEPATDPVDPAATAETEEPQPQTVPPPPSQALDVATGEPELPTAAPAAVAPEPGAPTLDQPAQPEPPPELRGYQSRRVWRAAPEIWPPDGAIPPEVHTMAAQGSDRSEASMGEFYAWLGKKKSACIRLAVMDMWKPFRLATVAHAPQAAILFDKFHVMRHLGEALDHVRKSEYGRLAGRDRRYIKGQKYTLLSRRENLTLDGKKALKTLLSANKRLNTAYVLKESFGQLWSYEREGWARRFFENWRAGLKWQRLKPYEKFAEMIERHWDGIAAYCVPENKVSLGFVEGLNNKIRVIQRRAYGLRNEEYLRLKILTCMLPAL